MYGLKLFYDHVTVKRWLEGRLCQNPEVVAAVLSKAWGIPIPVEVVWPEMRDGQGPVPAYQQAWVAVRTLDDLGALIGSDMLTRREILAGSMGVATGSTLIDPLARWLGAEPVGLPEPSEAKRRIGMEEVDNIAAAIKHFAALDAKAGGGLSREAAVGQLKYAVDLTRYASYSDEVGNRLLATIAGLSGLVGWMCHDSGMPGPAQKYLLYGLQAARESTDERAPLLAVRILGDLGQHARWAGHNGTAVRLFDMALGQLPPGRDRFNLTRAIVTSNKAQSLCHLGRTSVPEVRSAVGLSSDLHAQATDEERTAIANLPHRSIDMSEPELAAKASEAYLVLAREDPRLFAEADELGRHSLAGIALGFGRNKVLAQVRLARLRFVAGEPDQACDDCEHALTMVGNTKSSMVTTRLRDLLGDTEPYQKLPRVRELRERVQATLLKQGS